MTRPLSKFDRMVRISHELYLKHLEKQWIESMNNHVKIWKMLRPPGPTAPIPKPRDSKEIQ